MRSDVPTITTSANGPTNFREDASDCDAMVVTSEFSVFTSAGVSHVTATCV